MELAARCQLRFIASSIEFSLATESDTTSGPDESDSQLRWSRVWSPELHMYTVQQLYVSLTSFDHYPLPHQPQRNFSEPICVLFIRNIGAVAELIDTSCLAGSSVFHDLPDQLYDSWVKFDHNSIQEIISHLHIRNPPEILAQHYFITNPITGQGLSPKWDFTSSGKFNGNQDAFFVGRGVGSLPAPTDPKKDINWLQVGNLQGKFADVVFRTEMIDGTPERKTLLSNFRQITSFP